jgi:HlyD family secretion protein
VFAEKKSKTSRILLGVFAVLALGGGAVALRRAPVITTPVVRGTAVDAVYATGTVEAADRVTVKAKTIGNLNVLVREGAQVKQGTVLAVIDSPELKSQLARGKAEMWAAAQQASAQSPRLAALDAQARSTTSSLKVAREDRDRVKRLVASGSTPQSQLDQLDSRVQELEAHLQALAADKRSASIELSARASGTSSEVDTLAARLADTEVRAPMDGVVLSRFVDPGEVVMLNQPLFKIGAIEKLIVECAIDEADVGKVDVGKGVAISLYAFPDRVFKGHVIEVLPEADRAKKTFLTKVTFDDPPPGLRSGMSAEVNVIVQERPNALLAPAAGLDPFGHAFVVSGGKLERRTLKTGLRDLLHVEVVEGLAEGDQVVVGGSPDLPPGTRVTATVKPATSAAPPSTAHAGMSL